MADFVTVLRKTIGGLSDNTPEIRERVFEAARSTIEAKIAALNPQPPPVIIDRQRKALKDAIAVLRADYGQPVIKDDFDDIIAELEASFPLEPVDKNDLFAELEASFALETNTDAMVVLPDLNLDFATPPPPEPIINRGPIFGLRGGKLSVNVSTPLPVEAEFQKRLHSRLKKTLTEAETLLGRIENRHPEMVGAFREYSDLLRDETSHIDVVSVWAVGGALLSFAESYRNQNETRTTSEPLEPAAEALLAGIGRQHGAFIMGFEEGRDLVLRADAFTHDGGIPNDARNATRDLLDVLSVDTNLVSLETRRLTGTIRNAIDEMGWSAGRVSYSGYLIVRNCIHAIIKHTVGTQAWLTGAASLLASASIIGGDPDMQFARTALPIFRDHGIQMMAFTKHLPELRAYLEWALHMLKVDYQHHK